MRFLAILVIPLFLNTKPLYSAVHTEHATAYFSSEDPLEKHLINLIDKERKSIHVAIYSFSHRGIGKALIEAKKRGVFVEVVIDRASIKTQTPLQKMVDAGIPVYVWEPARDHLQKSHRPLMHHKYCLFGDEAIWTGSFNFTYEACRSHQENVVVLRDAALNAAFKEKFNTMKLKSCLPYTSYCVVHAKSLNMRGQKIR